MPVNPLTTSKHTIVLPKAEGLELQRLAAEREVPVSQILLAQIGQLRKELRRRIAARSASQGAA